MVYSLQNSSREPHTEFRKVETHVNDEGEVTYKTPNPRVKLSYTYLIAWFILHYPNLMTTPTSEEPSRLPYVGRYDNSDWISYYMSAIRRFFGVIKTIRFK